MWRGISASSDDCPHLFLPLICHFIYSMVLHVHCCVRTCVNVYLCITFQVNHYLPEHWEICLFQEREEPGALSLLLQSQGVSRNSQTVIAAASSVYCRTKPEPSSVYLRKCLAIV